MEICTSSLSNSVPRNLLITEPSKGHDSARPTSNRGKFLACIVGIVNRTGSSIRSWESCHSFSLPQREEGDVMEACD